MTQNHLSSTLESQQNWLITTHKGPDGDAVGSVVAWAAYAKRCNKNYLILFPDQPAAYLCPFLDAYNWEVFDANKAYHFDLLFALDYNAPSRVGQDMSAFVANFPAVKVMMDHHPGPEDFCQLTISNPKACSTTEVIYQTLDELAQLDQIAERRGVRVKAELTMSAAAAPSAPEWQARWERAVSALGVPLFKLPSGAGHDAMKLHEVMPQAMLFVRGENGGISHNPRESTTSDDMQLCVDAFTHVLNQLSQELS